MLTSEAIKDRQWGRFPTIRRILEQKAVPAEVFGPSTASPNVFSMLRDLAEVAIVITEYSQLVREAARPESLNDLASDLMRASGVLQTGSHFFEEHASYCRDLADTLQRDFAEVLSVAAGLSYEMVLRHKVYSCPASYNIPKLRLLSPRTAEGTMEKIFVVEKIVNLDPRAFQDPEINAHDRERVVAYFREAPPDIFVEPGAYRFYLFDSEWAASLPHHPHPPARDALPYVFRLDALKSGRPLVEPLVKHS